MAKGARLLYQELKQRYLELYSESEGLYKENIHIYYDYNYTFGNHYYKRYKLYYLVERYTKKLDIYFEKLQGDAEINEDEIDAGLDIEYSEMIRNIDLIKNEHEQAHIFRKLPMMNAENIDKLNNLFKEIVKTINPNVRVHDNSLKKLWNRAVDAYRYSDLDILLDCYNDMKKIDLSEIKLNEVKIDYEKEIKKYRTKIEILTSKNLFTKNSFPYDQLGLLKDEMRIKSKIIEIEEDIGLFEKRRKNLEEVLADFVNINNSVIC